MWFRIITNSELGVALDQPFNPPVFTGSFTEDDFGDEYWRVHALITSRLQLLGTEDDYGEGDFTMSQNYGRSRFIGVELSSKKLWTELLVSTLVATLQEIPEAYRVYIDHALLDDPSFYLLVHRDEVLGHSEDRLVLRGVGFPI